MKHLSPIGVYLALLYYHAFIRDTDDTTPSWERGLRWALLMAILLADYNL